LAWPRPSKRYPESQLILGDAAEERSWYFATGRVFDSIRSGVGYKTPFRTFVVQGESGKAMNLRTGMMRQLELPGAAENELYATDEIGTLIGDT
jgi:hypothetical protein